MQPVKTKRTIGGSDFMLHTLLNTTETPHKH